MKNLILLICFVLCSCQLSEKKRVVTPQKPVATFENALVYFRQGDYQSSYVAISEYLDQYPQTTKLIESFYLKGRVERMLGQSEKCLETFQILVDLTKQKKDSYYNYSLYQQGLCLENLGHVEKAIAVYQDALRSEKALPAQLKDLEIPSRLALSYSRLGEKKSADIYYKKLQKALKEYLPKKEFNFEEKQFYAEILFSMSEQSLPIRDVQDLEASLQAAAINKATLFQLLNLSLEPYTKKGLSSYIESYKKMYSYIAMIQVNQSLDPVVEERGRQLFQSKMAQKILESMDEFETAVLPEETSKKFQTEFLEFLDIKNKLEALSMQKLRGDGLTDEAQTRESIKKSGQVIDSPSFKEEKSNPLKMEESKKNEKNKEGQE